MSTLTAKYSSELMTNRLVAELISPEAKFEALQTSDGHAVLFTLGTDQKFYAIEESSGKNHHGWTKIDLSSKFLAASSLANAHVKTFEVGQNAFDGTIGMAMIVEVNGSDRLYLSLGNSYTDTSWLAAPDWKYYQYDDLANPMPQLQISNVFFCETAQNVQYIFVDILRDPSSAVKNITRYYIDTSGSAQDWKKHDVAIDIEAENYDSCIGRLVGGYYDGLYTVGMAGKHGQLAFSPVINAFGNTAPAATLFDLPGRLAPTAIASVRNTDHSTDLFVTGGNGLYYFAATNQQQDAQPALVSSGEQFNGVSQLEGMLHEGVITLWARNASDEVIYLSCPQTSASDPASWTHPVPITSGTERMSAFVNRTDGGSTIFAAGGGKLQRITRANNAAGIWKASPITLPKAPTEVSLSFESYTTSVFLTDEKKRPAKRASVKLSASQRCAVYINGIYYSLSTTPIHITANAAGSLNIVEVTDNLSATTFTLSTGSGPSLNINPMDKPFNKLASLGASDGDASKLSAATIEMQDGSSRPLVAPGTDEATLKSISQGLAGLKKAYTDKSGNGVARTAAIPVVVPRAMDLGNSVLTAAGDLFRWLESAAEAVVSIIEDAATAAWKFVVKIAGKVYHAILDTVEAIVGAAEWLVKQIAKGVKDIIDFVKFLFAWDDIKRTKEVTHNIILRFLEEQVEQIPLIRLRIDDEITMMEDQLETWAGIKDWSGPSGNYATPSGGAEDPHENQTAGSQHFSHHFQNNAGSITIKGSAPDGSRDDLSVIDILFDAIEGEAEVLDKALAQIKTLISDFADLTMEELIKGMIGILGDAALGSTKVVIDALLEVLEKLAATAVELMDTKIHIPIISDILNDIGIPDISFLDLFAWIGAVAHTVVYKIATGKAPFADNAESTFLKNAAHFGDLRSAFGAEPPLPPSTTTKSLKAADADKGSDIIPMSEDTKKGLFIAGHSITAVLLLASAIVGGLEASNENPENSFGIPAAVLGVAGASVNGATGLLVGKRPLKAIPAKVISYATNTVTIVFKLVYSGPLQKKFAESNKLNKLAVANGRSTGAVVNSLMMIPAFLVSIWHVAEILQGGSDRDATDAGLDEGANFSSDIARLAYAFAVNDPEPESREVSAIVYGVACLVGAGFHAAEAIVH